jgi:hypothetical protein
VNGPALPVQRGREGPLPINVMERYNDGKFAAANQRLNQLAALMK